MNPHLHSRTQIRDLKVGDTAFFEPRNLSRRFSDTAPHRVHIIQVGRKWLTFSPNPNADATDCSCIRIERANGLMETNGQAICFGRLWVSEAAYQAAQDFIKQKDEILTKIRALPFTPENTEKLCQIIEIL